MMKLKRKKILNKKINLNLSELARQVHNLVVIPR